jgi:hypothetical protein
MLLNLNLFFDTQFPNNLKPIEYYQFKIKKTPNQHIYKEYLEFQKLKFKNSYLEKLLIKYGYDDGSW